MKKSELISQAYQILSTDDRYVGIRANSLSGVEACLEVFLDLGMLPPKPKNSLNDGWCVSDYDFESEDEQEEK